MGADKTDLALSGVSEKFESKWLTVSEFQVFQVFQVCSVFWADSAQFARYFFGVAELMLMFVGVVDVAGGGHSGSWMIVVALCLSFCGAEKGL